MEKYYKSGWYLLTLFILTALLTLGTRNFFIFEMVLLLISVIFIFMATYFWHKSPDLFVVYTDAISAWDPKKTFGPFSRKKHPALFLKDKVYTRLFLGIGFGCFAAGLLLRFAHAALLVLFIFLVLAWISKLMAVSAAKKLKPQQGKVISDIPQFAKIGISILGIVVLAFVIYTFIVPETDRSFTNYTCSMDTDCILVGKQNGCCSTCEVEVVNQEEAQKRQRILDCTEADTSICPQYDCAPSSLIPRCIAQYCAGSTPLPNSTFKFIWP